MITLIKHFRTLSFHRLFLIISLSIFSFRVEAEGLPEIFAVILERDTSYDELSCDIEIVIDLPGLNMPEKKVSLKMAKGEETRIEGDGLMLVPKRGLLGQYQAIIETPCQAILLEENTDTIVYKLVSLTTESDWVTVDFTMTKQDSKVHALIVVTRENGVFNINHHYKKDHPYFPVLTVIEFEALPIKLPLKFIAQNEESNQIFNSDDPINGKVMLRYSNILVK